LDAAGRVCASASLPASEIFHTLTQLVDKSLLRVTLAGEDGEARFGMLETLREYAWDKLTEAGEQSPTRDAHFEYFAAWAQATTDPASGNADPGPLFELVQQHDEIAQYSQSGAPNNLGKTRSATPQFHAVALVERDNLRRAFAWAVEKGEIERGLVMVGTIWRAWSNTLHVNQYIPFFRLDPPQMRTLTVFARSSPPQAAPATKSAIAYALRGLGTLALLDADPATAETFFQAGLLYYRDLGDEFGAANLNNDLGELARMQGDFARAVALFEQNLSLARRVGGEELGVALHNLGQVEMQRGSHARARELFTEGMTLNLAPLRPWRVIEFLAAFAALDSAGGNPAQAAVLSGAVDALLATQEMDLTPADRRAFQEHAALARAQLGATDFDTHWARGSRLTLTQAAAFALQLPPPT
jgi:tetratricopeptide (TPR) repeat protein